LPSKWRLEILKYKRWQDRQASLYGKLLLLEGLKKMNINIDYNIAFEYTDGKRPSFLDIDVDFNISHTDGMVVCAITKKGKVGVDIEKVRKLDFEYYINTMTNLQWIDINNSRHKEDTFFKYWTIKESVLKGDGRGIVYPLDKMEVDKNSIRLDNLIWYVSELKIKDGYFSYLASQNFAIEYFLTNLNIT
jgi:4'-phosphopantetheinyl transferase